MNAFLSNNEYIDYNSEIIQHRVLELFGQSMTDLEKVKIAYEFVRDEIPHSFDCNATIITAKASDVLYHKTGICHAKANLLAVFLNRKWIKLDARGNKPGVNARFSTDEPILAYKNRAEYDEYFWRGIYASPHIPTMKMLEKASCLQDIIDNIPDIIEDPPDIEE